MNDQDAQGLYEFYRRMEYLNLEEARKAGIGDDITRLIANTRATVWGLAAKRLQKARTPVLEEAEYEQGVCVGALS